MRDAAIEKMSVYSNLNRPLIVEDYDTAWPALYEAERNRLTLAVNERIVDIQHIGSTSVPNTRAKPVIDIAMAIEHLDDALACVEMLQESGHEYVPEAEAALPDRRFLWRVAPDGQRYHVHLAEVRSDLWNDPIAFREYLRVNPAVAREYGKLKAGLADRCGSDGEPILSVRQRLSSEHSVMQDQSLRILNESAVCTAVAAPI